jgi:hypothetical protein
MADEATSYPTLVVATSIVSMTAWLCWAAYDIAKQRKAHPLPCDPDVLGRSSGAMGISRCETLNSESYALNPKP